MNLDKLKTNKNTKIGNPNTNNIKPVPHKKFIA